MKPEIGSVTTTRRALLRAASLIAMLPVLITGTASPVQADGTTDALDSWNDGSAKQTILNFVQAVTDKSKPAYVPPEGRIATFEQDGTLWVEHPLYAQAMFAIDRVRTLAPSHPEWKNRQPFSAVLSGDRAAMAKFSEHDWTEIIAATHAGMSTDAFLDIVVQLLATAKHPVFKRPYTELIYKPMLEVMDYLRANGVSIYIVTGGGQEFVRAYARQF
jgi:haloacid dehalogenase-like hydrolase